MHGVHRNVQTCGGPKESFGRICTHPNAAGMEILGHRQSASLMILMGMRHHQQVDAPDTAAPEIGRDYILTRIQIRTPAARTIRENPTRIHHRDFAVGKNHQQAIALAHVDRRQLQPPSPHVGRPRLP